ncbi:mCG1241, partial [Mus musculus]
CGWLGIQISFSCSYLHVGSVAIKQSEFGARELDSFSNSRLPTSITSVISQRKERRRKSLDPLNQLLTIKDKRNKNKG